MTKNSLLYKIFAYIRLARLDKPVGIFLLFLPCMWGLGAASFYQQDFTLYWFHTILFLIGAIVMRSAGCVINDLFDQDIDQKVERTKSRPIANGDISANHAMIFLFFLLLGGFLVLLHLNILSIVLGFLYLGLVIAYPLMKRITWWPQAFLGVTFNAGIVFGWVATTGSIQLPMVLLYLAAIFWTLGYDTIYGFQDIEDDKLIGVKSTSILLRRDTKNWIYLFYLITAISLAAVPYVMQVPLGYHLSIGLAILMLCFQVYKVDILSPASCLEAFKMNQFVGILPAIPFFIHFLVQ